MMKDSQCILCDAIVDSQQNGINSRIENRLLHSTESFIVTPCVSPLEPGHILITSKNHYQNLSCMSSATFNEIHNILDYITDKLPKYYSNYLMAEHGAYDYEQDSGACIIHTHIHIIPNSSNSLITFDRLLKFIELDRFDEIKKIKFPYILVATKEVFKIYHAENVPSQLIRRLVLADKGEIKDWDWRLKTNKKYNELTIKMWKDVE